MDSITVQPVFLLIIILLGSSFYFSNQPISTSLARHTRLIVSLILTIVPVYLVVHLKSKFIEDYLMTRLKIVYHTLNNTNLLLKIKINLLNYYGQYQNIDLIMLFIMIFGIAVLINLLMHLFYIIIFIANTWSIEKVHFFKKKNIPVSISINFANVIIVFYVAMVGYLLAAPLVHIEVDTTDLIVRYFNEYDLIIPTIKDFFLRVSS
jgi:hypothetical protein